MKRCPFCAEEIKDEAIKCRFCGEWLGKGTQPDNIETATPEDSKVNKDSEAVTIEEVSEIRKEEEPAGNDQKREEVPVKAFKEIIPWGWGWFILLGIFTGPFNTLNQMKSFSNETAGYRYLIELLGIALVLLMYYWLRNRSIRKKQYAKVWHSSFLSGFVSLFFVSLLIGLSLGIVRGIDNRAALTQFITTQEEMKTAAAAWNQEEEKLWEQINRYPDTAQGNADTVKLMKNILSITEQRKAFMDRYFAEYKFFYEDSQDVALISNIQEFKKLTYDGFDKYRKGIESYIEYFLTGDEEKEEIASKLLLEVEAIHEKAASLSEQVLKK